MASAMSSFMGTRPVVTAQRPARVSSRMVTRAAADAYPEPGKNPYDGDFSDLPWPNWADGKSADEIAKWQERELIHARWAMMGCAGAWGGEVGTGVPWFKAGLLCTPEDCTKMNSIFPGQVLGLAPEGSGFPNFYAVLAVEVVAIGLAEAYRTGLIEPAYPELEVGDLHPGGEHFDPLGLGADPGKLDELKLKELKNGRLAMASWLGYLVQAFVTNPGSDLPSYSEGAPGPYANWQAHVADPLGDNLWKYIGN
eukprot:evm.model.scf_64.15 EVM.evm.TU.scf_64.15   scf_64:127183-128560(-)